MGYRRLPSGFGYNSLSIKLSIWVSIICLVAGFCAALLMLKSERKQLLFEEYDHLENASEQVISQFRNAVEQKVNIAKSANNVVTQELFHHLERYESIGDVKLIYGKDGSIRSSATNHIGGIRSAAFIPQANFNEEYKRLFRDSEVLWQSISPTLTSTFFNYYFITKDNFIRISPPNWALNIEADHQFNKDIFYRIATPKANPNRQAVWTPIYFDDIWGKWMRSLIVPVYYNDEFKGVTGSDVELSTLTDLIPDRLPSNTVLFDEKGNILKYPDLSEHLYYPEGAMNEAIDTKHLAPKPVREKIQLMLDSKRETMRVEFELDDEKHIMTMSKIKSQNWYLGAFQKRSHALARLEELEVKFFGLFVLYGVLVAMLLHQTLSQLVLKRIRKLVKAAADVAKGQFDSAHNLTVNKDEIGALNAEFSNMAEQLDGVVTDLQQKLVEKEIAEQQALRLSKAVEFSGSGVAIANSNLDIEYVNPKLLEMTGLEDSFFLGESLLKLIAQDMQLLLDDIEHDLLQRHHWKGDTLLRNYENEALWVSLTISPIRDENHNIYSYVASAQDISFVKESQRKMEQLAYFDTLTGLANRAFFRMQLRKSLALAARGHYAFALFYFDLDEFKRINDTLGHDAGDQLLLEVAQRLQKRLRAEDTISRLGGDEFAILLSGINERDKAAEVALTIQETLNRPIRLGSNEVIISASIGITMAPDDSPEEDELLKHADLAMYEAKARGKNTYYFYNQNLDAAANERLVIENQLRIALKEQQFELYYQPQVDCITHEIVGFEALIRWNHPSMGYITPDKFIPIAEATGLIVELGEWILWESCAFAQRMKNKQHESSISINLSARQFKESNLTAVLQQMIMKTGIDPKRMHLELTESMLMGDIEAAIAHMHELKKIGVSLSIDDFGTGYSSLSYLKRFPVDILKIDRSFVKDIPEDSNDMEITAAIIAMAQKLNLDLVAEGVETREQVDFLIQNNCHIVQGYYFSPPVPEAKIAQLLERSKTRAH